MDSLGLREGWPLTMALRWSPNFCQMTPGISGGCIVAYKYVNGSRVNEPPFYEATEQTCAGHTGVAGVALATVLTDETRRRSTSFKIVRAVDSTILDRVVRGTYTGLNANRLLTISFLVNVAPPVKKQIQDACDLQFGPGKVLVS